MDRIPSGQQTSGQGNDHAAGDTTSQTFAETCSAQISVAAQATPAQDGQTQQLAPQAADTPLNQSAAPLKQTSPAPVSDATGEAQPAATAPTASTLPQAAVAAATVVAQVVAEVFALPTGLPLAGAPTSNKGDGNQLASKTATKDGAGAAGSKNSDLTNGTGADKSKITEAASGAGDASQHEAQSNNQPAQHSQPDPSQVAAIVPKATDGAAAQAQIVPVHVAPSQLAPAAPTQTLANAAPVPQHGEATMPSLDGDEAAPATGLNAARIIETMGETEMRVGMHSTDFGNISIRASVSPQQMVAQISLDHGDLGQAIASHASAVQTKLGNDFGMHASIEVNQQQTSSSGQPGSSPQREQRDFIRSAGSDSTAVPAEAEIGLVHAALAGAGDGPRLDIRA